MLGRTCKVPLGRRSRGNQYHGEVDIMFSALLKWSVDSFVGQIKAFAARDQVGSSRIAVGDHSREQHDSLDRRFVASLQMDSGDGVNAFQSRRL